MKTTMARDIVGHPPACLSGWRPAHDWSFNQSFAPVYQLVTTGDVSAYYSPGMRFRCVNGGMTKYFVVVHCAYAAPFGVTDLRLYGGTDYTLGVGITDEMYSTDAYPVGFPADPRKWRVTVTDTTNRSQAPPTQNVWYNLGGVSLSIPFGLWRVRYEVAARVLSNAESIGAGVETTLSTAADSEVDKELSAKGDASGATGTIQITETLGRSKVIAQAAESPVPYYLNTRTKMTNQASIWNMNTVSTAVITAECAYL